MADFFDENVNSEDLQEIIEVEEGQLDFSAISYEEKNTKESDDKIKINHEALKAFEEKIAKLKNSLSEQKAPAFAADEEVSVESSNNGYDNGGDNKGSYDYSDGLFNNTPSNSGKINSTAKTSALAVEKNSNASINKNGGNGSGNGNSNNSGGNSLGGDRVYEKTLDEVMHDSMLPYTEYVIMDRALPRVEDGLKPVQRRILYTMLELGLEPDKPFRKSARIVGDCLGKYHPHGDKSVYDAMVRMSQDFNMRAVLVNGHGNFGSIDGDGAAAMRYTEARLAPLAMELLRDINYNTVKFNLNFDDSLKEPEVLPGRFPNLLVNGASGIAVSLATNIPPHNLGEVIDGVISYIDNKNITLKQMLKIIKGPDFPTGGFLLCNDELEKAYDTGRGKVIMRAKISLETVGDKKNIIITELPYQVNKAALLQTIAEVSEEKKQTALGQISDIIDESDRTGMRAVIKLKKDANVNQILALLFKHTQLQATFGINIVAIADNRPQQMGLLDIIAYYVEYQRDVIYKRSKFQLEEAKEREHIVEGLVIATKNIDEVVKIIKKSASPADAKINLKNAFKLSDRQAQAILDMRLARLTNLEVFKLQKELEDLRARIKTLGAIINSKRAQLDVVKQELAQIKRSYKDERRTIILKDESKYEIPADDDVVQAEDCYIAMNAQGCVKRISNKNYNMSLKEFSGTLNDVHTVLTKAKTDQTVLMFTNLGNCHKFEGREIAEAKWKEKGVPLKTLAQNEKVLFILPLDETLSKKVLAFFTKDGMVKFSGIEEYVVSKSTFQAIKLKEGDSVIGISMLSGKSELLFITKNKMILYADKSDVPLQGRVSIGVKGINLNSGDQCVFGALVEQGSEICIATSQGCAKKIGMAEFEVATRYRKGLKITAGEANEQIVFASIATKTGGIVAEVSNGELAYKGFESFKTENRTSKGKQFVKLKKSEKIAKCSTFNI